MVHKRGDEELRTVLADAILALCRNTLLYNTEFCVEGVLGITLDKREILLVHIDETIKRENLWWNVVSQSQETPNTDVRKTEKLKNDLSAKCNEKRRKRGRPKKKKPLENTIEYAGVITDANIRNGSAEQDAMENVFGKTKETNESKTSDNVDIKEMRDQISNEGFAEDGKKKILETYEIIVLHLVLQLVLYMCI